MMVLIQSKFLCIHIFRFTQISYLELIRLLYKVLVFIAIGVRYVVNLYSVLVYFIQHLALEKTDM